MIPEIGQFALIISLCLTLCLGCFGLLGAHKNNSELMSLVRPLTHAQFIFIMLAFVSLAYSFIVDDFSVLYIANNSHSELPNLFKFSAVWGAHEGSLLLWVLILSVWMVLVANFSKTLPDSFAARVLGVLGFLNFGFLLFTLITSNPFERISPIPINGSDLNPLLQDIGLAIHPPILYIGYVGFAVAYAFAIAAMLSGKLDQRWARWTRPWTTSAWLFLTVGIALGSWWAYYELGWGGWWFWDPVENASFMPWLIGTALIHSLAVTEKRGLFKSWTLLLAISAFSLSLLGTFLVRSGILISVHAFATDPARGVFILMLLCIVIGGALVLYAFRAPNIDESIGFSALSRETFLLLNNVLLVIAATLILLGTLAPLILEVFNGGKISIGPPWFELAMIVPMIPLVFLISLGMNTFWVEQSANKLRKKLQLPFVLSIALGLIIPIYFYGKITILLAVGSIASLWIMMSSIFPLYKQCQTSQGRKSLNRSIFGMSIAHFGLGCFVFGVTIVSAFNIETDRRLSPGDSIYVAGYQYQLRGLKDVDGPNYQAVEAEIDIFKNGDFLTQLRPQKRTYRVQKSPMTEAGIAAGWNRDLFVALGEDLGDGSWSIRIQYKPMIRWIWLGCFIMALGGLIAVTDRRYRRKTT
ncbi:heme lyase CcmF/NrfE family subunit [Woeseiaceae bacterium]|jgi:cytochrome c-type biogenesis protein CcmF|nr:heme lyase CcmF/NrfE family subunit [Woeseiaceae bacterium]